MRRLCLPMVFLLPALLGSCASGSSEVHSPIAAERIAPLQPTNDTGSPFDIVGETVDGLPFQLSDHVQVVGEPEPIRPATGGAIVSFGAHWCQPCHNSVAQLGELIDQLELADVMVVYVHVDDQDLRAGTSESELRKRVTTLADQEAFNGIVVVYGGTMNQVEAWGASGYAESLPLTVFIAPDGQVCRRVRSSVGVRRWSRLLATGGCAP